MMRIEWLYWPSMTASRDRCPLRRSRPKRGQVGPQNRLAPGMCYGSLPEALSKASDAYAKLPSSSHGSRDDGAKEFEPW